MPIERKPTRLERRVKDLAKEKAKRKYQGKQEKINRREFLKLSAIFLTVGGGLSVLARLLIKSEINETDIILSEAKRQGYLPSKKEQELWAGAYKHTDVNLPLTKENATVVHDRFADTLLLMSQSENPHFKSAIEYLTLLKNRGKLEFKNRPKIGADPSQSGSLAIDAAFENNEIKYFFLISEDFVLNNSSSLTLAGSISHETRHLRQIEEHLETLPFTMSESQKFDLLQANFSTQGLNQEADAYAAEAQSYIVEAGLLGHLFDEAITGKDERAANFILSGSDPNGFKWREYIRDILP